MNSDPSLVRETFVLRLADRWRQAVWAIEANRITFARIEDDYLADRHNAELQAAYTRASHHQQELFNHLSVIRSELYGSQPLSTSEAVTLLQIVRLGEEDVFEDPELATAIDHVIAALSRTQELVS